MVCYHLSWKYHPGGDDGGAGDADSRKTAVELASHRSDYGDDSGSGGMQYVTL
jgi:hypothetical protein